MLTDAEDMVQETLLAAWRGLAGFQERASVRTWLYRIATNRCLNALRAAGRRVPAEPVPPFRPPEPSRRGELTWLQPYPDTLLAGVADPAPGPEARYQATEAVELAFVAGLQRLPARQAAALVLRDVLGFTTAQVAGMLGTGPAVEHELARRFADAFVAADVDQVVALLTDDAWLSMPPAAHEYHGTEAIAAFLEASFAYRGDRRVRLLPANANTQPAFGSYLADRPDRAATPAGLFVLTMAGDRIQAVTRFHLDALYPRFGLPGSLPAPVAGLPP